jgi:hypothetical protein
MDENVTVRRRVGAVLALPCLVLGLTATAAAQTAPSLGGAESFAALSGATLTNSGASTFTGDVGTSPDAAVSGVTTGMFAAGELHDGDAVAAQALTAATAAFAELGTGACTSTPAAGPLPAALPSGLHCVTGDAVLSAPLVLTGTGPWLIRVSGTLTATAAGSVSVQGSTAACNGSNVFWRVGDAALVASPAFIGTLIGDGTVTVDSGAVVDGRVVALDQPLLVTAATVTACSAERVVPVHAPIKVTGGGQIGVPSPDSTDPAATGSGRANYGFNAQPGLSPDPATGELNYRNHVTGLHVTGTVTDVDVLTVDAEGLADQVRFSGTCTNGAACSFSVVVDDNGEPAVDDTFGITVVAAGAVTEERAPRVVNNGNIQTHLTLSTDLNGSRFRAGQRMDVSVSLLPGTSPVPADAYLVLQLPNGQFLSWTGNGLVPGLVPVARGVNPQRFRGRLAALQIPPGVPVGPYRWLSALAQPGTLNLITPISEARFSIAP